MKSCVNTISMGILICLLPSCSRKLDGVPNVTFYNENRLLPVIHFKTSEQIQVYVDYWKEENPRERHRSEVSNGVDHHIVLYNISEITNYRYQIKSSDLKWTSDEFKFTSGEIPDEAFKVTGEKIDTSAFDGYILVRRLSQFGADAIINNEGEIVWYHLYDTTVRRAFAWTDKNTILSVYDSARIVEIDLKGNTVLDLDLERLGIPNKLHHEIIYNKKGQIVALTLDSGEVDLTHYGGKFKQNLRSDGIILIDSIGNKLWEWNLLDVAKPLMDKLGVAHLNQSWGHANSLTIAKDGHYVISLKEFNQVWKVNSINGSIVWRLGENGDFKMSPDDFFIGQHSIYFTSGGELMMFDNGSKGLRPNSRVLSIRLDETNMTATSMVKVNLPIELSAYRMGSAEQIEPGKYLVCTVRKGGVISVVNNSGEVIWKIVLNNPSYRAYYIDNPF